MYCYHTYNIVMTVLNQGVGFTRSQKQRMLLSPDTRLGLRIKGMLFFLGLLCNKPKFIKSFVRLLRTLFLSQKFKERNLLLFVVC